LQGVDLAVRPYNWRQEESAVLLLLGAVCLAAAVARGRWSDSPRVFVFSGDPYVNGATSRWSRRSSHVEVFAAWLASAVIAAVLRAVSRRPAVAVLPAAAAVSQDLD
jgi:hypothetical protein